MQSRVIFVLQQDNRLAKLPKLIVKGRKKRVRDRKHGTDCGDGAQRSCSVCTKQHHTWLGEHGQKGGNTFIQPIAMLLG